MKIFNKLLLLLLSSVILLGACKKSDRDSDTETQSATDNAKAEKVFADLFNQVAIYAPYFLELSADTLLIDSNQTCPTMSISPALPNASFPKVLTIDFGSGCTGSDGVLRKGKIIASFSGKYKSSGTIITYTLDNYYYGSWLVNAKHTVTNAGFNADSNLVFLVNTSAGSMRGSDGTIYWNSARQREWISGMDSPTGKDDAYLISGTADGTGLKGSTFNTKITSNLSVSNNCAYIKSGTLYITPGVNSPRIINFGSSCSKSFTVEINGVIYSLEY